MKKKFQSTSLMVPNIPCILNDLISPTFSTGPQIMDRIPDPKLATVDEYEVYFKTVMTPLSEKRVAFLKNSIDQQTTNVNSRENRYPNITSILATQPSRTFFNGNLVSIGNFTFLVTQAPMHIPKFYQAIVEFCPQQVIQITRFAENLVPKAERYVPLMEDEPKQFYEEALRSTYSQLALTKEVANGMNRSIFLTQDKVDAEIARVHAETFLWHRKQLQLENVTVTAGPIKVIKDDFYQAELQIASGMSSPEVVEAHPPSVIKPIYTYYGSWGDFQGPEVVEDIIEFCKIQYEQLHKDQLTHKLLVHCSAGIGRSATFAICMYIYSSFKEGRLKQDETEAWKKLHISIYDCVEALRTARNPQCVQTPEQFAFLFRFCERCGEGV